MSTIASALESLDGDIVILPEVQDCCVVDYWYTNYFSDSMKSKYNYYLQRGTDYYTGQNLLLLTKIDPIGNVYRTSNTDTYPQSDSTCSGTYGETYQSVSKNVIANFSTSTGDDNYVIENFDGFVLFGLHLLAQPTNSDRCGKREAQATTISGIIRGMIDNTNEDTSNEFIIMGDLNDWDKKWPDKNSDTPITSVLRYLKESTNYGYYSGNLTNTAQYINQTWRYTHWPQSLYDESKGCYSWSKSYTSQYDYILLSEKLSKMIDKVTIGWGYCGVYYSDHLPLIVDLVSDGSDSMDTSTDTDTEPWTTSSLNKTGMSSSGSMCTRGSKCSGGSDTTGEGGDSDGSDGDSGSGSSGGSSSKNSGSSALPWWAILIVVVLIAVVLGMTVMFMRKKDPKKEALLNDDGNAELQFQEM